MTGDRRQGFERGWREREFAMPRIRQKFILLSTIAVLSVNGCNSSSSSEPEASATVKNAIGGVGSTFVAPLMKRWIIGFQNAHPQTAVHYRAEGSGAGIEEIKRSMTEFAASDAPLTDEQLKDMPPVIQVPVSAGPVCIIYNIPELKSPLRLTWNDPAIAHDNPGVKLPKAAIVVTSHCLGGIEARIGYSLTRIYAIRKKPAEH
jgi:phosphate transport system substrate-binding protein